MEACFSSFDGTKIFYRYIPLNKKKPVLVFIHSLGSNWTLWKQEILLFEKKGYSTLTFDLRGHGLSGIPSHDEDYFFPNFAKDLHALLERHHIRKFILIGHSFGGGVAINYCGTIKSNFPQKLILVETAHRYPFQHHREFNVNPFVSSLLRYIAEHEQFRKKNFPHFKELDLTKIKNQSRLTIFLHALQLTPLKSIMACIDAVQKYSFNHLQDTEKLLSRLRIPVLVIAGSEDSIIPLQFSEELHWLIRNSKLKIIIGAYHRLPLESPHELSTEILQFIEH